MKEHDIQDLVRKKLFLIDCFLFNGSINPGKGEDPALKHGVTNYYLTSVILELHIKVLFELDTLQKAPYTHNVLSIYEKLNDETKFFVRASYDRARARKKEIFKNIDKSVTFPPLHQVLQANESFIKNLNMMRWVRSQII